MSTAPAPASGANPESVPDAAPSAPPALPHPIRTAHFRNLWIGATISLLGDQFYLVALPWLVLQLTGSSLALGTILMAAAIPRAALMLLGGAVTDRFSARRVITVTAAARAILVGTVAALAWLGTIELWELYALTIAFGIADAFSQPAAGALIPSLVKPQQLQRANSMFQSSTVLTQMIGPAPAGLVIKSWGIGTALLVDALSFLGVIAALLGIPDPPKAPEPAPGAPPRPSIVRSIGAGLQAVRKDPQLLSLIVIYAAINLCIAGPIGVGLATMSKFRFASEATYGILLSCFSGGLLPGILLGGMVKRPRRRGLQFIAMSTLTGLELIGIGFALKPVAVGALLALMGLGVGFVNVQVNVWIQTRVDRSMLGRVMSVLMMCAVGLVPISYAAAGFVAQWNLSGLFIAAGAFLAATSSLMAIPGKGARSID
jgi:MFS family permease